MSLVDIQPTIWPYWNPNVATFPFSTTPILLDAVGDRIGVMFSAPKSGVLDRMEFDVMSGSALQTLRLGWQGINLTTGFPDGTFTHWADISGYTTGWIHTMGYFGDAGASSGAKKTVAAGDLLAFIISAETATTPNVNIRHIDLGTSSVFSMCSYPRGINNLTGTMATNNDALCCALFYDGESNPTPFSAGVFWPADGSADGSVGSTFRMMGNRFRLPFRCRATGAYVVADLDADVTVRLYSGITDLLGGACVIDKDIPGVPTGTQALQWAFPTPVTLDANTWYRLVLENTTATSVLQKYITIQGPEYGTACPGGIDFYETYSTQLASALDDESDWSDATTFRMMLSLIIDQIDDGVSGYGGGAFQAAWAHGSNVLIGATP